MAEPNRQNPIRETDDEARRLARRLIGEANYASLAVLDEDTDFPVVSRIAVAMEMDGSPYFLASDLSGHSRALAKDGRASILCGVPPAKGDPLAFPRVTVIGRVTKLDRQDRNHPGRREAWLAKHPKAALYVDFGDFNFYRMRVERVSLNGGFGKAYEMTAEDLKPDAAG